MTVDVKPPAENSSYTYTYRPISLSITTRPSPLSFPSIGVRANFSGGGGDEPSLPEKYFDSARKTATLTYKIALSDSPHLIIVNKNAGF